ncbi:glycoside hydrolase family 97 catalytic domain-containing protein [Luteolibacter pohnpeiensis]|uniref:Glycoside hydrolase family 97 catalytic domain-containing protein n=2 Tax=Luteolibacter pohnpeiensis TaxID=454153 RepID=A0A934S723_9BACT|nr:glycoside hydrolase family 97 catalytic domain-containing protein [Luteolibacter pohnpeiensis]
MSFKTSCISASVCLLAIGFPDLRAEDKSVWLDDYDVTAFSNGWGKAQKNQSISGNALQVAGRSFDRGAGVHAPSLGVFRLAADTSVRFQAMVGADDGPENSGTVQFLVIADGKTLFDSGVMKKGDEAKQVDVDLTGHQVVRLQVTDAGDGIDSDHADWADAKFISSGAAPVQSQAWEAELSHFEADATQLSIGKPDRVISSPDGSVKAGVGVVDGRLVIKVIRDGKVSLDTSPIGITVDGVDLGQDVKVGRAEPYTTDVSYSVTGHPEPLHDFSKAEKIEIAPKDGKPWTLDVRCYNDGVAWRYIIPGRGSRTVSGEATSFVLPEGATYWSHHNTANYEANFLHFQPGSALTAGQPITMPVTVELPDGGYACISEDSIMDRHYSGMTLGPRGRTLNGIFEDDSSWKLNGEIISPWRIVITARDLTALVNQSIVYNLAPDPDPKLFPDGPNANWIQPGRAFWTWGFGQWDTAQWDRIKGFVNDAATLNCQYYVIDDPWREPRMGWHRNGKDEWASLKEVCDYAATKHVKIMVWEHWGKIRDKKDREEFFENVSKAGAVGVKIDFMDSESQERLEFFHDCLVLGAKHHIMINFHGANKPAGEERTWPNWMTREAIYGMEQGGRIARSHLAALPFTRFVTGPADFTPMAFQAGPMGQTTAGSQMATAVAYNSPLNHWADSAQSYLAQPKEVLEFIRTKPVVWDETLVLPGSKIGELAAIARRAGENWWVSVINGTDDKKDYSFNLDFLGNGRWSGTSFEDGKTQTELKITHPKLRSGQKITATLAPGGGFVLMVKPE